MSTASSASGVSVDCTLDGLPAARGASSSKSTTRCRAPWATPSCTSARSTPWWRRRGRCHELRPEPSTPVQERVAANVASLIPDGATLQMGIGGIPNAVLACLRDHRDLGIHSEMCSGRRDSADRSGRRSTDRARRCIRGKIVAGFVLGTKELFDFIHENPVFEFPSHALHQRSVRDRAERPDGRDQLRDSGGSHRPGLRRFHRHDALQRIWRTTRFHARRGALQGRQADHRAALDGQERYGLAHRAGARPGRRSGDHARRTCITW